MPRGKRQPITVGDRTFNTLKDATEFVRQMLNGLPQAVALTEPHDSFLRDLIFMHPRAGTKIRAEISHFSIGADSYKGRCFFLHRSDGTSTDFSYLKCLSGEKLDDLVFGALRTATMDQIQEFRQSQFDRATLIVCPFTGSPLDIDNCHVDHAPPQTFYKLVHKWLAENDLTLAEISISQGEDNKMYREITNPAQRESWCSFHLANATLRLTSKQGNLSHSKIEARGSNNYRKRVEVELTTQEIPRREVQKK
jgi:hypothetical protein